MHTFVYINIYTDAQIYIHVFRYIHTCICVYIYIYIYGIAEGLFCATIGGLSVSFSEPRTAATSQGPRLAPALMGRCSTAGRIQSKVCQGLLFWLFQRGLKLNSGIYC